MEFGAKKDLILGGLVPKKIVLVLVDDKKYPKKIVLNPRKVKKGGQNGGTSISPNMEGVSARDWLHEGWSISCEIALRWIPLQLTQHAVSQRAITWANVDSDSCRHMASLCHNESIIKKHSCVNGLCIPSSLTHWGLHKLVDTMQKKI